MMANIQHIKEVEAMRNQKKKTKNSRDDGLKQSKLCGLELTNKKNGGMNHGENRS